MNKEVKLRIDILCTEDNFCENNYGSESADNGHYEIYFSDWSAKKVLENFYEWSVSDVKTWNYFDFDLSNNWKLLREYYDKKYSQADLKASAKILNTFTLHRLELSVVNRRKSTK